MPGSSSSAAAERVNYVQQFVKACLQHVVAADTEFVTVGSGPLSATPLQSTPLDSRARETRARNIEINSMNLLFIDIKAFAGGSVVNGDDDDGKSNMKEGTETGCNLWWKNVALSTHSMSIWEAAAS